MKIFWQKFITEIEKKISPQIFDAWFKSLTPVAFSPQNISFGVPNSFTAKWIKDNHLELIRNTIRAITTFCPDIEFVVVTQNQPCVAPGTPVAAPKISAPSLPAYINPELNFDNFVVGSSNQFAHAACQAVAERPGGTYNPLFVYGGVGLGKTHLMQAIVNRCVSRNPECRVCYVTSETFTNEMINSIRYERMPDFRKKYRTIDLLLLDDIEFIAGKERTQEEFFHTFNALFEIKKQMVVTSEKKVRDINDLEERLRSRFAWGLVADIQPPETETKVAILKKKALVAKLNLSNEVAFLIASSVKSNVRDLEGALNRLSAFAALHQCSDISVDFARDALRDFIDIEERDLQPEEIQKAVCRHFNIKISDIRSKKKNRSIVLPRQIAMYITRQKTTLSFPEIGQCFGGKDHATVMHSIKKINALLEADTRIKEAVDSILKKL